MEQPRVSVSVCSYMCTGGLGGRENTNLHPFPQLGVGGFSMVPSWGSVLLQLGPAGI